MDTVGNTGRAPVLRRDPRPYRYYTDPTSPGGDNSADTYVREVVNNAPSSVHFPNKPLGQETRRIPRWLAFTMKRPLQPFKNTLDGAHGVIGQWVPGPTLEGQSSFTPRRVIRRPTTAPYGSNVTNDATSRTSELLARSADEVTGN